MDNHYIEKIIKGDDKAFEYLINKYKDMSYTISYRILRNEEEAEECVQDAFMKVYRSLSTFKEGSRFSTWLYKIVYNTSLSRLKSHKGYKETFLNIDDEDSNQERNDDCSKLRTEDQKKYIQLALEKLEEGDSLLITLFYLNELSMEEIAEVTSWSAANIKVKLHRARKKLSTELKNILKTETSDLL